MSESLGNFSGEVSPENNRIHAMMSSKRKTENECVTYSTEKNILIKAFTRFSNVKIKRGI